MSDEYSLSNLNDILEKLITLRKKSLSLYFKLKTDNFSDKELLAKYFKLNNEIKNINQFLLQEACLKEYHIKEYLKGIKHIRRIEGSYNYVRQSTHSGGGIAGKSININDYEFF